MTKEKIKSLEKYKQQLKDKLNSAVPPKHANRVEAYKSFLNRELKIVSDKLLALIA